jgi:outer membrane protein OmpA-like peptidoglycan-associated protein
VVASAGQRSRGCRIQEVKVVGLPDHHASGDAKLALARERAAHVAETLKAAGFPEPVFQLNPLGDAAASQPAAALPRRRADVYVRFSR